MVTCILAKSSTGLLSSAKSNASTFLTLIARVILADHNYTFFGAQYRAFTLDSSGSRLPLPGLPAEFTTELPAKLYSGRTFTCWVTISNFIYLSIDSQRFGLRWAREYAVLTVSDNGSGISANDLERIFEPFYTKKVMGRSGTGLGLAVVWNTVQDHDGYINVKTSKKGTAFELYFPVTRDEVISEGEAIPVKDYMGHSERVLVVDDEERQREIACGILAKLGYDATAVSSGEEAVEFLKEQSVDLIVLDMIMPKGINGCETYERIIEIHPGQKAIIASGYAETPDVKKAQGLGAGQYVKKPYTMGKIGLAVKEELEK